MVLSRGMDVRVEPISTVGSVFVLAFVVAYDTQIPSQRVFGGIVSRNDRTPSRSILRRRPSPQHRRSRFPPTRRPFVSSFFLHPPVTPAPPLFAPTVLDRLEQTFKPNKTPVDLTVTVGSHGLGLILTEDKEGSRWGVKGFRVMPDGLNNPGKVSPVPRECVGADGRAAYFLSCAFGLFGLVRVLSWWWWAMRCCPFDAWDPYRI